MSCRSRIDHATLGARTVGAATAGAWRCSCATSSDQLVPVGDEPVPEAQHLGFLDGIAALSRTSCGGGRTTFELLPHRLRWAWFGAAQLDGEAALGLPEDVPRIAYEGWERFAARAPADVVDTIDALRRDPTPLSDAILDTPQTFLHGDWKMGNLGTATDGRVILLDWAYPGRGPVCHELAWYLALNRSRLPRRTHEGVDDRGPARRARSDTGSRRRVGGIAQLELCLLGAVVQFGWEKALRRRRRARLVARRRPHRPPAPLSPSPSRSVHPCGTGDLPRTGGLDRKSSPPRRIAPDSSGQSGVPSAQPWRKPCHNSNVRRGRASCSPSCASCSSW